MKQLLLVFLGGGLGSALRFGVMKIMSTPANAFPYGTLSVNILGSLIIGILLGVLVKGNPTSENMTVLLVAGFCGGFTTFSAFALENYQFLKNGDLLNFSLYTGGSILLGLLAVFLGIWLGKAI
ncbi:fluoride efflux transporter CrcB [Constantimarinum furrinae]|uniref:Fluoride-specific ion channel FluC n=1 Tax=Constantimarinum furrinae TaxID=2562285 RepID=A0A7G8PR13_9FLAO|nr:fluoride efflux transporter CrcB [Constantimarinum furrinae]QNJ96779.1 protein CrcB [Constantimarinum furrinae]